MESADTEHKIHNEAWLRSPQTTCVHMPTEKVHGTWSCNQCAAWSLESTLGEHRPAGVGFGPLPWGVDVCTWQHFF